MASSSLFPYLRRSLLHAVLLTLSYAQSNGRIRLGSSLTAQINQTDAWYSPSGEFAFGFRPLETDSSLFLLAIWFTKTADRTAVWYANGDRPVQAGSKVELTEDGKLNLTDHAGQAVWNVTNNISDASYAGMLDTGNFKITRADNMVAWQTFDDPRDTILPSKELAPGQELRSRLSETDYSVGKQKFVNQDDGNLVFYNVSIPSDARTGFYWASNTFGRGLVLVFDPSGSIYFTLNDGYRSNFTTAINYPTRDFYHRARLDPDGLFRQYVHPKNGTADEGWTLVDFQPDICLITENGNGGCGNNSYCQPRGNGSYDCLCPPQYSYVNPNKTKQGCRPNFPTQNCLADEMELEAQFDFTNLNQIEWRSEDYDKTELGIEEQCKNFCLRDCECLAAIYENYSGRCRKKKFLSNGRMGANVNRTAFVKIPSETRTTSEGSAKSDSGDKIWKVIIIILVPGFLLLVSIGLFLWKKNRRKRVPMSGIINASISNESRTEELDLPLLDLFTIESATDNFSINNKLGEGGYGPVYKGQLRDGQEIAVKRLSKNSTQGLNEFKNEIMLIAKLQHRNLVRLLGCCIQGEERMLIYEYMQNKSLDFFIFDKIRGVMLNWQKRLDIIMGIARGLLYLHQDSRLRIIHRDLKASNILLDKDMNPKISDFGTARLFKGDQNQENTRRMIGTFGYMPPEYAADGIFSVKSDVFSFGVLILEILSGKKNKIMDEAECSMNLIGYAWRLWEEGRCLELFDEAMERSYPQSEGLRCIQVGLLCLQEASEDRPSMAMVILMLSNEAVALPQPQRPGLCIGRAPMDRNYTEPYSVTLNEATATMLEGR